MPSSSQTLADLVRYSGWASGKLLAYASGIPEEALARAAPNSHGGIVNTFRHIYYADRLWLARLESAPRMPFEDPAPGPALADLDKSWPPLVERFAAFVEAGDPASVVHFRRLTGDAYSLEMDKIVRHVVNHGTYHRGQIAAMLKQAGHTPPSTDLLFYHLGL